MTKKAVKWCGNL